METPFTPKDKNESRELREQKKTSFFGTLLQKNQKPRIQISLSLLPRMKTVTFGEKHKASEPHHQKQNNII